ncbi:response regulator transcription factor [Marinifilum sp. RC60d5]|uniref:response regulator transcription factor n=1 Tax=Marinifilum sp. RC60d5 TaxID=3458414 RepID=UPI00403510B6
MPKTTILIAENLCLIRKGLYSILQKLENAEVVQTICNKDILIDTLNRIKPNILIVNPNMMDSNSSNLKQVFENGKSMSLVLISDNQEIKTKYKADAYLLYSDSQTYILDRIQELINKINKDIPTEKSNDPLSAREKNILKHIALGLTNKEMADQLFISIHTVVTHRKNITHKLGIKSVSGLTVYAILHNLISMDEVN